MSRGVMLLFTILQTGANKVVYALQYKAEVEGSEYKSLINTVIKEFGRHFTTQKPLNLSYTAIQALLLRAWKEDVFA